MYLRQITNREAGQRLDRYLCKLLPLAGTGFLHKMLRKKNITLNGKKAQGSEKLMTGDQIAVFFAEETLQKFMGHKTVYDLSDKTQTLPDHTAKPQTVKSYEKAYQMYRAVEVIYENAHILLADKPAGILTQKASPGDVSLNEGLIGNLLARHEICVEELDTYRPSVCNRLDRNTSGIVLCAKTVQGAQLLQDLLQKRTLHKYYQLYVKGILLDAQVIEGFLTKDNKRNKVSIQTHLQAEDSLSNKEASYIKTSYRPLKIEADKTLLEVELITGKPHQIRAHLAAIGHPLLGDYKYGDKEWNDYYKKTCQIHAQLLHAYKVIFPDLEPPFEDISGKTFQTGMPPLFDRASKQTAKG